jgi:hypothetical protein
MPAGLVGKNHSWAIDYEDEDVDEDEDEEEEEDAFF